MKAGQGCWTCKRRKIGCDKQLPACQNCLRTGRQCLGYGVRLVWPDQRDGRRKLAQAVLPAGTVYLPTDSEKISGQQFLNLDINDFTHETQPVGSLQRFSRRGDTLCGLSPWPNITGGDLDLLRYYERSISTMISTIDSHNGFRTVLLPRALSQSCEASTSLRNAILAVSCFHRFGAQAALPFKTKALQCLSRSLARDRSSADQRVADVQLAASLMLCVYSVFDETEGNWHLHLNGAKSIIRRLIASGSRNTAPSFLFTWFLYHEVLGGFSQYHRQLSNGSLSLSELELRGTGRDHSNIIGSLGCSLEVLDAIRRINVLRDQPVSRIPRNEFAELETKLLQLKQQIDINEFDTHLQGQIPRILGTAELYRLAALIYLLRVVSGSENGTQLSSYINSAFHLLKSLPICTSPWPLFVLACEAESDEHRIMILDTLDAMDHKRKIGNVFVLRDIIECSWKKQDLKADSDSPANGQLWNTAALYTTTPWFI